MIDDAERDTVMLQISCREKANYPNHSQHVHAFR